ncbi:MAG: DegT/DnrJ/EryC1/StrS family aminotransferase [Candidatus Colwellbacteria bacterium]|nr:DegT/DnrJ/EryC1/StrS family aminotransferase [Candidatus Colwellbacteria bacterium]
MPKPITVGLSPNTESDDAGLALKLLFNPKKWLYGNATAHLEEEFRKYLPAKHAWALRSARAALQIALSALELKQGDEVITQSYTCTAVPNAILATGGTPVYADIDENNFNISVQDLEKKINNRTRAIIVQHTFGIPAQMDKILEIAREHRIPIIEDCAHALGAEYQGKKLGTFGDMAIFSFGRDKVISSVFGGMITTNSGELSAKINTLTAPLKLPSRIWTIRQLLHPVLFYYLILPTYNIWIGKAVLEIVKRLGLISKAVQSEERRGKVARDTFGKIPNTLAELALHQFKKLERFNLHRRKLAEIYRKELSKVSNIKLPEPTAEANSIYLRYTIRIPIAKRLIKKGRKLGIILDDWYNPCIAPKGVDFTAVKYNPGACPIAERAASESLNLPTNILTSEEDALKITKIIKDKML